jgi:hypothetical protein
MLSEPLLGWMVEDKQIAPHVPVWDKSERKDDTLSSSTYAICSSLNLDFFMASPSVPRGTAEKPPYPRF